MSYNYSRLLFQRGLIQVKGLYLNGRLWWVRLRIPKSVRQHYTTDYKKKSLGTSDKDLASERAALVISEWLAEFESIKTSPPIGEDLLSVADARELLQDAIDERMKAEATRQAKAIESDYHSPRFHRIAETIYDEMSVDEVLNVAERKLARGKAALNPKSMFISDALTIYLAVHRNGSKDSVSEASDYAIRSLIESVGDLQLVDLEREHVRYWITDASKKNKTTTVQRQLNQLKAIFRTVALETNLDLQKLYEKVSVPGLGKDAKKRFTPSMDDLKRVLTSFPDDHLIRFLVHFGGRISELSGLMKGDVHLDAPIPYVAIQENEVRSLKTPSSKRDFPLVGEALIAMRALWEASIKDPSPGLLPAYFKPRGGDSLSANLNKKLKRVHPELTTHCLRHGMKDLLLRVANVPEYLCNEIQGHGAATVARSYGAGAALAKKAEALERAYEVLKLNA